MALRRPGARRPARGPVDSEHQHATHICGQISQNMDHTLLYKAVSVRRAPRNAPQAPPSGSQCYESLNRYAEDTLRISKVVIALLEDKSWRQMLKGRLMKTETESKSLR